MLKPLDQLLSNCSLLIYKSHDLTVSQADFMYAIYYPAAKGREVKNADQIWKEETALESAMHPSSQRRHLTAGDGVTLCRHFAEA